jgi:hypothetical protein
MNGNEELSRSVLLYRASARVWLTILLAVALGPLGNLITCGRIRSARLLAYLVIAMIGGSALDTAMPAHRVMYPFSAAGQLIIAALATGATIDARSKLQISDQAARDAIEAGNIS